MNSHLVEKNEFYTLEPIDDKKYNKYLKVNT